MILSTDITKVKGVGPKTALQLQSANINTVEDMLNFLPRRYDDFSDVVAIEDIKAGKATIKAKCESITTKQVRRGLKITTATLVDDSGRLQAVWFNQPYRATQLKPDEDFLFSGDFEFKYNKYQLTNPSSEKVSDAPIQTDRMLPVYRHIKGLKSQTTRKILNELKPLMTMLPETLPGELIKREGLISRGDAMLGLHFPKTASDIESGRERFAFEELFQLLLASQYNRQANSQLEGWVIPFQQESVKKFVASLPFNLTNSQRLAAWEVLQDFERQTPMNRLLQGDVGAGKTVVAGLAMEQASRAGMQSALMAPTEILASQHAETLRKLLGPFGITVGLLTGSVKTQARKEILSQLATGGVDVVVGTHALIQDTIEFHKLGFVVIDEQHRFGVKQRQQLLDKSTKMPHLLAMTATPIPRSLALTVYGELDVSVLRDMPKGRKPIETHLWSPNSRTQLYDRIDQQIELGRQVYVVCSLIDDNPDNDTRSVEAEYKRLSGSVFKHRRIGLLHGRLKPDEKTEIMTRFLSGELDILVSTTVVEVGVDVPNATVMMIENADQFGLSQLHQLRGRVGRSEHQSYCYLVMTDSKRPSQRLREIEKSGDGFYLAEVDLRLRGPGEIYGKAQHGALNLQIATLADTKLIARAQSAARRFVESGLDLIQYKQLADQVHYYQRLTTLN
ncbi:MAG: ATP-dependent DNA helicase RecG [bacterium]|nr:ATP-dependent DNA helicase RecG [bacterium]MDN5835074.1 ATP-dependent DNA helicase RecG [bacterium]